MKILLTGPNGFVGSRILSMYKDNIVPSPSLRDATEDYVRKVIEK